MMENLSIDTVIIVACVCGSVVLVLSIILIVLCCQRHRTKDLYEKTDTNVLDPSEAIQSTSDSTSTPPDGRGCSDPAAAAVRSASPAHPQQHQQPQGICGSINKSSQPLKECNSAQGNFNSSNPTIANYASLERGGAGGVNSSSTQSLTAAPSGGDDKRLRKVIYEVIV